MDDNKRYTNSVFEEKWWLDTVANGAWDEITVRDGNNVVARFAYAKKGKKLCNPPYTQTMGIWMDESLRTFKKGNSHLHRQKDIINEIVSRLPKVRNISITLDCSNSYVLPFRWKGFRIEPTFSYRLTDLRKEHIDSVIGKTVRKNLKASSRNLTVDDPSEDYDALLSLIHKTYERQNRKMPYDDELTMNIIRCAVSEGCGRLLIARDDAGIPHSAAFLVYDERVCYYLLGGQDPDFKSDGSMNLLLLRAIEFAAGVSSSFDFEGSMIEGIENFFRQFGGEQVINYHVTRQSLLNDIFDLLKPRLKKLLGYKN